MTEPRYPSGTIVEYPYLWRWQAEKGREHAEKHRPVCLRYRFGMTGRRFIT